MSEADLKIKRRQGKAAITRHLRDLSRYVTEEDRDKVVSKLEKLRASYITFEEVHTEYHDLLTEDKDLDNSDKWMDNVTSNYNAGIKKARDFLKSIGHISSVKVTPDPTPAPDAAATAGATAMSNVDVINVLSIPKVELEVFSGNPSHYSSFMAVFDESVASKVTDDQQRLTRLLQYTSGPAKAAIRNCALIGGSKGYDQACEILKERFGSDHLIAQKIVGDLKFGKTITRPSELQQLGDDLRMAVSVLEKIDLFEEVGGQQTIRTIVQRCPQYIRNKWKDHALKHRRSNKRYPAFREFALFMNDIAGDWGDPVYGHESEKPLVQKSSSNFTSGAVSRPNDIKPLDKCLLCDNKHKLFSCDKFRDMHPWERVRFAKDSKLCFNCLLPKHIAKNCKKTTLCSVPECGKRHTKFLHIEPNSGTRAGNVEQSRHAADNATSTNSANGTVNSSCLNTFDATVYMPIIPVLVNDKPEPVLALMDTGGSNTLISERLAKELQLKGPSHKYVMNTVSHSGVQTSVSVNINVSSLDGTFGTDLNNVLVNSPLPARYPKNMIDISQYPHLADIPLPKVQLGDSVDLIIGMDNGHLLFPLESRRNPDAVHEPYAIRYAFGWCLNGSIDDSLSFEVHSNFLQLQSATENSWQFDNRDFDEEIAYSVDDRKVTELWDREIHRDDEGHYVLPIPWKDGRPNLPNNKFVAQNRLESLTKRLARRDMTETYADNINQMIDRGYAERVPENELLINDGSVWYLPHHPVISASKPDKVRPVFDCAATFRGVSLNNQCYQGPDLINKLVSVLLRFRQFRYAITGDVESMYLQVRIPEADRNALRFLWYDKGTIVEYRMTAHLFGGIWCAASSTYALRRTVIDTGPSPLIRDTILKSFYVDDALKSCVSIDEAVDVIDGVKEVLGHGGFRLTKFTANDRTILDHIDTEDRAKEVKELVPNTVSKALGIQWDVFEDTFHYVNKVASEHDTVTRRKMLSFVSSMYDPLGLVSPIVILGKLLFQEATRLQMSWDDVVPASLSNRWIAWLSSLQDIDKIKFDRCVLPEGFEDAVIELHHFGDASSVAYGACTYVRAINREGKIHVALLAAKYGSAEGTCIFKY